MNNLQVVTTTSDMYQTAFGFTEEEVFAALDEQGLSRQKEQVKMWYDGFRFGHVADIYNPWSILGFLKEKRTKMYWANTSSSQQPRCKQRGIKQDALQSSGVLTQNHNKMVGTLIQQGSVEVKKIMEDLLQGGTLSAQIDFSQLEKKRDAIWSLFLASGYLKVIKLVEDPEKECYIYTLALTNREVKVMMKNLIRDWFGDSEAYNTFIRAMLSGDIKAMNHYMNRVAMETFSFFDTGNASSRGAEPERFYHGFVLGLLVDLGNQYQIRSNRESGFGRYDIMLKPMDKKRDAIILEFKVQDTEDEASLHDTVESALKQITEKQYDAELIAEGIPTGRIRYYGFAFCGKKVLIG